jgi:hypothetical protein
MKRLDEKLAAGFFAELRRRVTEKLDRQAGEAGFPTA